LDFHQSTLSGGIPLVASTFDNVSSATVGLALRVDGVPDDQLVYLSALPDLMRNSGVIADGHPVSNDEMSGRIRREILNLNLEFAANYRTQRDELVITGAGNNVEESQKALAWMKLAMFSPNWTPENLPRLRDVIDQSLGGFRTVMQGAEEDWVMAVHDSYWRQNNYALLATGSFLTVEHNYQRLRWMLMDAATPQARTDAAAFLDELARAGTGADRAALKALLAAMQKKDDSASDVPAALKLFLDRFHSLSPEASRIAAEAAKDLDQDLNEVPDDSLASDWSALAHEMRHDLQMTPAAALANLNAVRQRVLNTGNARMFVVGSQESQRQLQPGISELIKGLATEKFAPVEKSNKLFINSRLQQRRPDAKNPIYVGLVSPTLQKGVFLNTVPTASFADVDREALLRYLSAKLYGGHGTYSAFSRTIAAGLAYSNGLRSSSYVGSLLYYAERVPELPQTLKFVIDMVKHGESDSSLVESAIAEAFASSRPASDYEARGAAMAGDFADGLTPQIEERFFRAVLDLRKTPDLSDELFKRMPGVYSAVLPGYSPTATPAPGGIYLVIGSPRQLNLYQNYLQTSIGPDARLYRIYPRDFWMVEN
jgi:Zn-dependent M16 (insulinase) family peptidase